MTNDIHDPIFGATEPPRIEDFSIYHVGLSGGKDSTALALWVRYESGLPQDRVRFSFCDSGNEDPLTYAYLGYLGEHCRIVCDECADAIDRKIAAMYIPYTIDGPVHDRAINPNEITVMVFPASR